jgi:hypothetical protein
MHTFTELYFKETRIEKTTSAEPQQPFANVPFFSHWRSFHPFASRSYCESHS